MAETPGGELAIWWTWTSPPTNRHLPWWNAIQRAMVLNPPGSVHCPQAICSPNPRAYFGSACWRMRSLLGHLCPPWSHLFIYLFLNLFLRLGNGSKWYSFSFMNSEWQRWRREEDVARFCHRLWCSSSSSSWVVCLWAQLLGSQSEKARPCWKS